MSYCRWSTGNFTCDLYCYSDVNGGWTTHVASARIPEPVPSLPSFDVLDTKEGAQLFTDAMKAQHDYVMTSIPMPIDGPFDGCTFNDPTLEAFEARLLELRKAGYRFPDAVLDHVRQEIAESTVTVPKT